MESCIINPKQEVWVKTVINSLYWLSKNWKLENTSGLDCFDTWEGDFSIAGTRQGFPISLNAYVNPNLPKNQEFVE